MSTVLLPWVEQIPWKQQSILFSGLRGPDNQAFANVKKVCRWMRRVSQNNADPTKGYMNVQELPKPMDLDPELENCTVHFVHHFADALRVIAEHHPDLDAAQQAWEYHHFVAEELFHFVPEDGPTFRHRHRDVTEHD